MRVSNNDDWVHSAPSDTSVREYWLRAETSERDGAVSGRELNSTGRVCSSMSFGETAPTSAKSLMMSVLWLGYEKVQIE